MRRFLFVVVLVGVFVLGTVNAFAASPPVVIDDLSPLLDSADNGAFTVPLGFTNLTDREVSLTAQAGDASDTGCNLSLDPARLPGAVHTDVAVDVPAGCKAVADDGIDFTVDATRRSKRSATFAVTAAPKPADNPDWDALWSFVIAFGALFAVALLVPILGSHRIADSLEHLDATWSFQDSWVANITVLAGLLTGIFGTTDVVTAFVGPDADSATALATVGAAVAAAFIAAAPIFLLATKNREGDAFTVGGLLGASVLTLTGAVGELWVVYKSASKLDLGGWEGRLWIPLVLAAALLAVYAVRTLIDTIRQGTTTPGPTESDTIKAAEMIVAALTAKPDINAEDVGAAIKRLPSTAKPRRRSALP